MGTGCRSPVLWRRGSAARTGRRTTRRSAQSLWPLLAPVGLGLVIAGGESWADPAIVSPNGLPVQVNPTFPEPGLPAFSFPQGGLSDTGGVAGAVTIGGGSGSGSGSGSASLGSYSGTGSGVAGAIVATGYADLLGQSVGTGQCVALAQASSDVGYTSTWSPGAQVEGETDIAVGTVIATFGSDGAIMRFPSSAIAASRVTSRSSATRSRSTTPVSCSATASASAALVTFGVTGGWRTRSVKIGPCRAIPVSAS